MEALPTLLVVIVLGAVALDGVGIRLRDPGLGSHAPRWALPVVVGVAAFGLAMAWTVTP